MLPVLAMLRSLKLVTAVPLIFWAAAPAIITVPVPPLKAVGLALLVKLPLTVSWLFPAFNAALAPVKRKVPLTTGLTPAARVTVAELFTVKLPRVVAAVGNSSPVVMGLVFV